MVFTRFSGGRESQSHSQTDTPKNIEGFRSWTHKKHIETNRPQFTSKNCSYQCAYDSAQLQYTIQHRTVLTELSQVG